MADKEKKGFLAEFREFISRGNVVDMAVGVIIATAFGKITTSLVGDVVMPAIGYAFGGVDLAQLNIVLQPAVLDETGAEVTAAVTIGIGSFLVTIIDFLLIALVVFLVIRGLNAAKTRLETLRKHEEAAAEEETPPEPSAEELLLTEIRDLLREQQGK